MDNIKHKHRYTLIALFTAFALLFIAAISDIISAGFNSDGTANYIPKFHDNETLNNSVIYQDAYGRIGIGTPWPNVRLTVNGTVNSTVGYCINDDCITAWNMSGSSGSSAATGSNNTYTEAHECGDTTCTAFINTGQYT